MIMAYLSIACHSWHTVKSPKKWFCLSILSHAPVFFKYILVVHLVSLVLFSK